MNIFYALLNLILLFGLFSSQNLFARKILELNSNQLLTIPYQKLMFLEGFDEKTSFKTLEQSQWSNQLKNNQSLSNGYWVKFMIKNNLTSDEIGLNHNWNREKKLFVKNSLGLKEYPYWKQGVHNFLSEGRIGAQHKIIMPKNEVTIIYDFFRDRPFDRYMAKTNGLDRMTIGLWEDIKLRELFRFVGNIISISITFGFGFYYLFIYLVTKGNYLWLSLSLFQWGMVVFFTQSNGMIIGLSKWFAVSEIAFAFQGLFFVFLLQFFRKSLDLKRNFKRVDKIFLWAIGFYTFTVLLNICTSIYWPHAENLDLIAHPPDNQGPGVLKWYIIFPPIVLLFSLTIVLSSILWKRGHSPAKYMCLSFVQPLIAVPIGLTAYFIYGFSWQTQIIGTTAGGLLFLSMFITFGFAVAEQLNELKRFALEQQIRLTEAYQRFVPKQLLSNLKKKSILEISLGDSIQTEMTLLFSDIRSFTSLSESMTPEENFKFVNNYLSRMGPIVRNHGGYIDKFIGDAIMAIFDKSPNDALFASIKMLNDLRIFNDERSKDGHDPVKIGIGVNTGTMMLGTLGESDRMEGSVISDAVNLASRLEGLTKLYKTPLLISDKTFLKIEQSLFQTRLIDKVTVKGKEKPILIYEVLDGEEPSIREKKLSMIEQFKNGLELYQNQSFEKALTLFKECHEKVAEDYVAELYNNRCQELLSNGWDKETWDGINHMDFK